MLTFLLWRSKTGGADAEEAAAERTTENLRRVFSPVFEGPPAVVLRSRGRTHLAFIELPVRG
ncbi:MAG: hypothetical protein E4H03_05025 [Myxococcales bacterium]|nr:MAG: hypothetical protein E4H03_05025 [Myxococcales bacterium]